MSSLYELTGDFLKLLDMIEDEEFDEDVILDTLEGVEGEFNMKMESYAKVIKNIEAQIKALKEEEQRLSKKRKSMEKKIASMKDFMFATMKATEKQKAGGDIFTISIQKNGGKLPLILDVAPEELPLMYQKVTVEADTESLREYLDAFGENELCHYGERSESLRIR